MPVAAGTGSRASTSGCGGFQDIGLGTQALRPA